MLPWQTAGAGGGEADSKVFSVVGEGHNLPSCERPPRFVKMVQIDRSDRQEAPPIDPVGRRVPLPRRPDAPDGAVLIAGRLDG